MKNKSKIDEVKRRYKKATNELSRALTEEELNVIAGGDEIIKFHPNFKDEECPLCRNFSLECKSKEFEEYYCYTCSKEFIYLGDDDWIVIE